MAVGDMPTFAAATYGSTSYAGDNFFQGGGQGVVGFPAYIPEKVDFIDQVVKARRVTKKTDEDFINGLQQSQQVKEYQKETEVATRRFVQVIIVDPDENMPLDQCLLHKGDAQLTDATDQELYFELDMKSMLSKHNEYRVKVVNKKVKDRVEHLEPAKVRDLKMVVVTIASF